MNIILYANGKEKIKSTMLIQKVKSRIPNSNLEIFQNIEDLFKRISRLPREIDVAILSAQSISQLSGLLALKDLLEGIRVILILPDRQKKTVSMGLNLYPRFVTYSDGDMEDFGAILEKMHG